MRIAYCTTIRLPSERARSYQAAKVVEALQHSGHFVEVFSPSVRTTVAQNVATHYGLDSPVHLRRLGSLGMHVRGFSEAVGKRLTLPLIRARLKKALRTAREPFDLLYTTSPELVPALARIPAPILLELRQVPRRITGGFLRILRRSTVVVTLTSVLRQELIDNGLSRVPVIVESDGVDLKDFQGVADAEQTKEALSVPSDVPLILFVGQLKSGGMQRGIEELLDALDVLRGRGLSFRAVIVGGPGGERERFVAALPENLQSMVSFTGHVDRLKIPSLLVAADVLVAPAPKSDHPFFLRDFSPLQLFEYMAAGRPMVAADLPPFRDVVDDSLATFYAPGNAESLAMAIRSVLDHPEEAMAKAQRASAHVEQFSWERRMERVIGSV